MSRHQDVVGNFVRDVRALAPTRWFEKWRGKLPPDLSIQEVVDEVLRTGGGQGIVDSKPFDWKYNPARAGIVIGPLENSKGFEVFMTERGGKFWVEEFIELAPALTHFFDYKLNYLGVNPPDSTVFKDLPKHEK